MPPGTITIRQQVPNIRAFVTLVTHVYGTWLLTCKKTVDALWHDLQLYKHLMQFEMINKNIALPGTCALNRYLWYFTAEMVPLTLFSHHVPETERKALVDALLDVKQPCQPSLQTPLYRFGAAWGKPKFPSITITMTTQLRNWLE